MSLPGRQSQILSDHPDEKLGDFGMELGAGHLLYGEFVKQIHALTKLRKVKLVSLQPLPPVKEEVYNRIPIRLLSVGSFTDIHHLLWDLETMDRVVVMEKIVISRPDINQRCQVNLTAIVFEQEKAVNRGP